MNLSWSRFYQEFSHEEYSQLPYDEVMENQAKYIYKKITKSYLHKVAARPTILPYAKVVRLLVQQAYVSNLWLMDALEQPLASYRPK